MITVQCMSCTLEMLASLDWPYGIQRNMDVSRERLIISTCFGERAYRKDWKHYLKVVELGLSMTLFKVWRGMGMDI